MTAGSDAATSNSPRRNSKGAAARAVTLAAALSAVGGVLLHYLTTRKIQGLCGIGSSTLRLQ